MTTPPATEEIPVLPPGVKVSRLDNGLTLIIREDHSAPVVSAQAWCATGSIDEDRWLGAGLSHVLEHMLFKGTKTRGAGRIDQEVQEAGGYMNAYTSFDRTVYWINVPNTGARVAIDILCDIMQNAALPPDELAKELDVIRREMDMGQDDPSSRAGRRLFEVAYTKSPYRFTIIGYLDIFNQLKPEDIRAYYEARYAPNNCFFVVTGDIRAEDVEQQIREAYAGAKEKPLPPVVLPEEPRQVAPRVVIEEAPIELGHFHCSWHIPDLRHPDVPVLDVLAVLLGSGRSSRLYREVREKQGLVNYADAWTYNPGRPGLFGLSAVVDPGKFEPARDAMLAEIERMKREPVAPEELTKAVKQFVSATLASRKTMQGQAQDLGGNWLAANDLNFSARYLAAVQRITPADLQRVAREYLTVENRTVYALLPAGTAPQPAVHQESSSDNAVQKFILPTGLRLLVKEDHRLPFVEFRAVLRGGVLAETPANSGISQLLSKMLLQGTASRSAEQIAGEIESVGGSIDTFGGNNSFGVTTEVLSSDFNVGLELLADVLLHPQFPEDALEREQQIQLAAIRGRRDELLRLCGQLMRRNLFGEAGYGLDNLGTETSVPGLKTADLRAFHAKLTAPENCVLAVYGDVKAEAVRAAVERTLAGWRNGGDTVAWPKRDGVFAGGAAPKRVSEVCDKKQAVLVLGFGGTTMFSEDRYALELLQEACSDLGSRLFLRIREKLGLAYYVGAQHFSGLVPGYFAFYAGTEPGKTALVEAEFLAEAKLLCEEGLSEDELKRAKAKIIGQKKIARQELGGLAMGNALDELYGLGYDRGEKDDARYEAVTAEQVRAVARKYLRPETSVLAVICPKS
jgi:zinc protease